ncbi:DUF2637 domain-containing protein [Dactylosporangium sp. CA-152071]|uniref:DUF2637 domain-containing protein n=1 Tax=Dactylosporangium sp. CA-152071 TaxID=3239933 RepID=UPI003D8A9190
MTARIEGGAQVLILLAVAGMAGAASFTHVHDWTMHNSPHGTGDWFGWANAAVTELIPLAAGLEARRRRSRGIPVGRYPIAMIVGAVTLSLAGQFAEAKPGLSGWIISAIPALGFLALIKLVLSTPPAASEAPSTVTLPTSVDVPAAPSIELPADVPTDAPTPRLQVSPDAFVRVNGAAHR